MDGKKISLYKFTHMPLLKNNVQLKQKIGKKERGNYPNLFKKEKSSPQKKVKKKERKQKKILSCIRMKKKKKKE